MPQTLNSTLRYTGVSDTFSTSGTSAQSAAISAYCQEVRIVCTANCWYNVGANPTATAGDNSVYLPAGLVEYIHVSGGQKIAAIQDSAAGVFCMAEMAR